MLKPVSAYSAQKLKVIDRLIIRYSDDNHPSICLLQEQLPLIFRITAIEAIKLHNNAYEMKATIFHEKATLNVQWNTSSLDDRLVLDQLVAIRWKGNIATQDDKILISRLTAVETPNNYVSLLDTIPNHWCEDKELLQRGRKLIDLFSATYRGMFNTIFWNKNAMYELVSSSLFMSTVERCEGVMKCEYKFFIDINQTTLMLLINTCTKLTISEVIVKQIAEATLSKKHMVNSAYWNTLLMSLSY
jgi:hypothetical protein